MWSDLPHFILSDIFSHISLLDLKECLLVCQKWYDILQDEFHWKNRFKIDWDVPTNLHVGTSWYSEYRRLHSMRNLKPWASLTVHDDEVLHVTMSHCGHYICTSSKDKSIVIWKISEFSTRSVVIFKKIRFPLWMAVQQTLFNGQDTLLLVSGVCGDSFLGEVMIYSFPKCKHIKTVNCVPYDSFGTWLGNTTFIVGDFDEPSFSATVTMHSVFPHISPKTIYSDPNSNPRYPYHCKLFETCSHKSNNGQKFLFYACADSTLFAHSLAIAIMTVKPELEFERDGLVLKLMSNFEEEEEEEDHNFEEDPKNGVPWNNYQTPEPYGYTGTFKGVVNLKAAIIGLNADKNTEKVFVNCRSWLSEETPSDISKDIELRIFDFDLNLLRVISKAEAITPSHKFFLIHISTSPMYAVSGDEKGNIHIFDSHYNTYVCTLPGHSDVVNSVVISPVNPYFMCSVSDDHTIKLWDMPSSRIH